MKTRSPFLWASMAGLAVVVAAFTPVVWQMVAPPSPAATQAQALPAPWVIERDASRVLRALGLRLPGATLRDAVALWGDSLQVALVAHRGQALALEAYTDRWTGGGVTGKLVLATDAGAEDLARWQSQSTKREMVDADAQRWRLNADDRAQALASRVVGLSFLPAPRIDAATLEARFGVPAEKLPGEGTLQHWLYPATGLAIAWDAGTGRALIQLAPLRDFEARLAVPVRAASAASR
jgi:hypothetical protein